jgi:hypothetical protein
MPIIFKCIAPCAQTVFDAVSGELVIGRIQKEMFEGDRFRWSWRLDVAGPARTVAMSGFADNREGAEAALTNNWMRWLAVSRLRESEDRVTQTQPG